MKDYSLSYENVCRTLPIYQKLHQDMRRDAKIICLTEKWDQPLMWAHYADSHQGVALKYSFVSEAVEFANDDPPLQVFYEDRRPVVSTTDIIDWLYVSENRTAEGEKAFRAYALQKSNDWEYELEWRIQKRWKGKNGYAHTPCLRLEEIIIGVRGSVATIEVINEIVGKKIPISFCQLDEDEYSLVKQL